MFWSTEIPKSQCRWSTRIPKSHSDSEELTRDHMQFVGPPSEFVDSQRFNSVCLFGGVRDAFSKLLQAIPKSDLSTYVLCLMIYLMSYDLCLTLCLMTYVLCLI